VWKIRKPKPAERTTPQEPPNYEVPRWCARQCVMLLRGTHLAFDEMHRMVQAMPPEKKALYYYLCAVEIRPSFADIMKLIDLSEERGFLTRDEAAEIRAGKVGGIENPLPPEPESHDNGRR
jgi:hypothetical protein